MSVRVHEEHRTVNVTVTRTDTRIDQVSRMLARAGSRRAAVAGAVALLAGRESAPPAAAGGKCRGATCENSKQCGNGLKCGDDGKCTWKKRDCGKGKMTCCGTGDCCGGYRCVRNHCQRND